MADDENPNLIGQIKDKLIRTKEKWAEEGRLHHRAARPGPRQPASAGPAPREELAGARSRRAAEHDARELAAAGRRGQSRTPTSWTLAGAHVAAAGRLVSDIHCVTPWARYDNHWDGVSTTTMLDLVQAEARGEHIVYHSYDGYTTNVKARGVRRANVLIAHSWEASRCRASTADRCAGDPDCYFWKSAKWVTRIEFAGPRPPGFWEVRGYHNEGDPWKEERYS